MRYGYIRVSSSDQRTDRQQASLLEAGVEAVNLFTDKMSGKNFDRPAYKKLVKKVRRGDTIVISSIDRLGRNYDEILEQWRILTREKGVYMEVLNMSLLNTAEEKNGLTGEFIADLVLQILAYVAQTEREFIKQRQAEGIALAKARGVRFGATSMPIPEEFDFYYQEWRAGKISTAKGGKILGVSQSTFYRWCRNRRQEEMD